MRLIDADALLQKKFDMDDLSPDRFDVVSVDDINNAPTILEWNTITCRELEADERDYFDTELVDVIFEDIPDDGDECILGDGTYDIWFDADKEGCSWENQEADAGQQWIRIDDLLRVLNGEDA